jgi:hypothetical protein
MATLSIFISDAKLTDVLDAFCESYRYCAKLPNGKDNPESQTVFVERMMARFVEDAYSEHTSQRARDVARGEAATAATIRSASQMLQSPEE